MTLYQRVSALILASVTSLWVSAPAFVLGFFAALWSAAPALARPVLAMPNKDTSLGTVVRSLWSLGTQLVPGPVQEVLGAVWVALVSALALGVAFVPVTLSAPLYRLGYWVLTVVLGLAFKYEVELVITALNHVGALLDDKAWAQVLEAALPPLRDGRYHQGDINEAASIPLAPAPTPAFTREPSPAGRWRVPLGPRRDAAVLRWRSDSARFEAWIDPVFPGPTAYMSIVVPAPRTANVSTATGTDRTARSQVTPYPATSSHVHAYGEDSLPGVPMVRTPASTGRPRTPGPRWSEQDIQGARR
ncbi:uncharacterized protein LOC62_01G001039 [Vanrija pseudolonga]|uniref:Uncharacterized protein n=1 Tax=Vanrija pseudolonga TaxID=143232 RepID=A0AAF1BHE7_9TREE|nr:hypothetical protein LOC62_01G001039 [Vanrija pseudolonga]